MREYTITYDIEASWWTTVCAESEEEALELAHDRLEETGMSDYDLKHAIFKSIEC